MQKSTIIVNHFHIWRGTLGLYCPCCEIAINHVPEVEHIAAKSESGAVAGWDNLLLGCKYCNIRKGKKVTPADVYDYFWPDKNNTASAYTL